MDGKHFIRFQSEKLLETPFQITPAQCERGLTLLFIKQKSTVVILIEVKRIDRKSI